MDQSHRIPSIAAVSAILILACVSSGCGNSTAVSVAGPSISRCDLSVTGGGSPVPAAGGTGTLNVNAERECTWSARTESTWLKLSNSQGQGPTALTYSVEPNPNGTERRGRVVFDQVSVEILQQATPCRYELTPPSLDLPAQVTAVDVTVHSPNGCSWAAQVPEGWLAVEPPRGSGTARVVVRVAQNAGAARTATVAIGGETLPVHQASAGSPPAPGPECRYQLAPTQRTSPPAGETFAATLTASSPGCSWSASSDVGWISIVSAATGTGSATVRLEVQPNSGPARTGAVRAGGQRLTLDQGAGNGGGPGSSCSYTIDPVSMRVNASATDVTVNVRTANGCGWTASTSTSWIAVTSGQTGSGNGPVRLSIAANAGAVRSGSASIAGVTFSIEQAAVAVAPCSYSIRPTYYNSGRGPDDVRITVTTAGECSWTAASGVGWARIVEGRNGTGPGTVRVLIEANAGAARSTTLTIAGQPFTLSQEGNCEATLKPTYYNAGPGKDDFDVHVKVNDACSWTASSPVTWATIDEGRSGTGDGNVRVKVEPNAGGERTATLTIAGAPFTLTQRAARR